VPTGINPPLARTGGTFRGLALEVRPLFFNLIFFKKRKKIIKK